MDIAVISPLLYEHEGETLDFKRAQYKFYDANADEQSELLKDILAFANAWKRSDAYILIGIQEVRGANADVIGVNDNLKDNDLQQFVDSKTNKPVRFIVATITLDGKEVDVIRIDQRQDRPVFLKRDFGGLKKATVYVRRGSSTDIADLEEIADMGAARHDVEIAVPTLELGFADSASRTLLGHQAEIISRILVSSPAHAPDDKKTQEVPSEVRMSRTLEPTKEELWEYHRTLALFAPLGL